MTQSMFQIMMQKQCEPIILLDVETQCEELLKRTMGTQTIVPHKKKSKKLKKIGNPNDNGPVGTPLTPIEKEKHKLSTPRALYYNGSVASLPPSAQTVMIETDSHDDESNFNGYENDSSDSTTDQSDEEGLKNEKKLLSLKACLTSFLSIAKLVGFYVRLKSLTLVAWYQSKRPVVITIPFIASHNHSYITSLLVTF